MKKLIRTLVLVLLPYMVMNAQQIVKDPTNDVNMGRQIQTSIEQYKTLQNQLDFVKKVAERLKKVNQYLLISGDLNSIKNLYKSCSTTANLVKQKLQKSKNLETKKSGVKNITTFLTQANTSINFLNKILTNGLFSMSDKERIDLIREQKSVLLNVNAKLKSQLGVQ